LKHPAFTENGDDLGLPWEKWADGMPHRLRRTKEFGDYPPELVRRAAKVAAARLGKGVQATLDRPMRKGLPPRAIWVLFTDHEVRLGDPCKCGGRRLVRVHPQFARCTSCGAKLLLARPKESEWDDVDELVDEDEDEELAAEAHDVEALFRELEDVHLARIEHAEDRETYRGYARRARERVLVLVQFRADRGERLTPENAAKRVAALQVVPLRQLRGLVEASSFDDDWDLEL
jgi:hypothetical protein